MVKKRYAKQFNIVCQYFHYNNMDELHKLYSKKLKSFGSKLLVQDLVTISLDHRDAIYELNTKIIDKINNNKIDEIKELLK